MIQIVKNMIMDFVPNVTNILRALMANVAWKNDPKHLIVYLYLFSIFKSILYFNYDINTIKKCIYRKLNIDWWFFCKYSIDSIGLQLN